jgi:hypothetical protein
VTLRRFGASVCIACACLAASPAATRADDAPTLEYQIKASMLFNFLQFVEWPPGAAGGTPTLTLGIVGDEQFGRALDVIDGEVVAGRRIVVRRMKRFDADEAAPCNVLFICASEKNRVPAILAATTNRSVLTVGETPGFLDAGGMINFVVDDDKLRFEINRAAERQARLVISSKLLRLASSVRGD